LLSVPLGSSESPFPALPLRSYGHPAPHNKEQEMAQPQHTLSLTSLEEALSVLFCLIDDAYTTLNPTGIP
jgi:hypothetical protein